MPHTTKAGKPTNKKSRTIRISTEISGRFHCKPKAYQAVNWLCTGVIFIYTGPTLRAVVFAEVVSCRNMLYCKYSLFIS